MKVEMASKLLNKGHRVKVLDPHPSVQSHNRHLSFTPAAAFCVGVQLTVQFRASDQNRDLAVGLLTSAVGQVGSFPTPASLR